jgi:glycosyltransferase involved in cell wall biosynthesis
VINTSKSEDISLSIIEAQQLGVPVVVTNVGSSSEIVVYRVTGLLSNLNDNFFREKLDLLLNDNELRNNMKQSAEINATKKFSFQLLIQNHVNMFSRSLNSHK